MIFNHKRSATGAKQTRQNQIQGSHVDDVQFNTSATNSIPKSCSPCIYQSSRGQWLSFSHCCGFCFYKHLMQFVRNLDLEFATCLEPMKCIIYTCTLCMLIYTRTLLAKEPPSLDGYALHRIDCNSYLQIQHLTFNHFITMIFLACCFLKGIFFCFSCAIPCYYFCARVLDPRT